MFWKKLMNEKEWRVEKWVVIALFVSFILTGGIHFYSQKINSDFCRNRSSAESQLHHCFKVKGLWKTIF